MAAKVCPSPGCHRTTKGGRCPDHARPGTTARGYDHTHRREREAWQHRLDAGEPVKCWRCGRLIGTTVWHLGHVHDERDTVTTRARRWPEHASECNLSAAGRAAHA